MTNDLVPTRVLSADEAYHVGTLVHTSGLFGDIGKAEQAAVKVMAGAELGIGAIAATRGIDIIKGEVSLSAGLVAALVRRSPDYDYDIERWDDEGCTIVFSRHDKPLNPPISFTKADATRAGLDRPNRDGSPGNYQKYPRNMYFARAMTNGARLHCPDLFAGSVYTSEELGAEPVEATIVEPGPPPTALAPTSPPASVSAPQPETSTPPEAPPGPSLGDTSTTDSSRSSPTPVDGPQAPEPTTPAEVLTQLGMDSSTQQFMLVAVGVEDIGDIDTAYASLTDEQAKRIVELARERAAT